MAQYYSATGALKDKRLSNFLDTAGAHLHASKNEQILVAEIRKATIEIQYIEDKVAIGRARLQKTTKAIEETEIRLREAEKELSRIRKERAAAEGEHEKLQATEREIHSNGAILADMKKQIAHVRGVVRRLSARFKALQSTHRNGQVKKETLEKEVGTIGIRSSALEKGLPVMRNTRDLLVGILPEGFDVDTIDELDNQDEIEKAINDYIAEVNEHMERLEKERSGLNRQIDEKDMQQRVFLSRKDDLEGKVKGLTAEVGGEAEVETVIDEVERLRDEKERLGAECEAMMKEGDQLESNIKILDDELEAGKKLERELTERNACLTSRKQEMDQFDDMEAEIKRLQKEMQKCERDSSVNDMLTEIIGDIKEYVGLINGKLRYAVKDYNEQFDAFINTVRRELFYSSNS
jgi:chromosome segregation ATPase